jgi:hypothetical protein
MRTNYWPRLISMMGFPTMFLALLLVAWGGNRLAHEEIPYLKPLAVVLVFSGAALWLVGSWLGGHRR